LLVEHAWVRTLDDAVARTGGKPLASRLVDAAELGELTADPHGRRPNGATLS
jgi:hypothetical protein